MKLCLRCFAHFPFHALGTGLQVWRKALADKAALPCMGVDRSLPNSLPLMNTCQHHGHKPAPSCPKGGYTQDADKEEGKDK